MRGVAVSTSAIAIAAVVLAPGPVAAQEVDEHVAKSIVVDADPRGEQAIAGHAAAEHAPGAAGEHHGGGHHGGFDWVIFGQQMLNFGILLALLIKFGGGAIGKQMRARHAELKADLEEAARLRAAADARLKQQEARLANLEQEVAAVRAGIRKEAEDEKARLIAAADERAQRIREETAFLLEQQVKEAQIRLRHEGANAALRIAEALLRKNVGPQDQAQMASTFIADVEKEKN